LAELADLLSGLDKGVRALIAEALPPGEYVRLSLVGVEAGSAALAFATNYPAVVDHAVSVFNQQIGARRVDKLPKSSQELVAWLKKWTGQHAVAVALVPESKCYDEVPWISGEYVTPLQAALVYGETIVEGILLRVGGKVPKLGLLVDDLGLLPCNATEDLAKQAGRLLYQRVVLEGQAAWDASTWSLVAFTAHAIVDYSPGPQQEALAELARLAGADAWSDWDDVQSLISELRKE